MLFTSQMNNVVNKEAGESLYFVGTSYTPINDNGQMMHVVGVKNAEGNIQTKVEYLSFHPDRKEAKYDETVFNKVLDPVDFERFINDMAIATASNQPGNRLIELSYPVNGIDDSKVENISDRDKHLLFKMFLIISTQYKDAQKGYQSIKEMIQLLQTEDIDVERLVDQYIPAV